jgi:linoleoyl-CoA desaturase
VFFTDYKKYFTQKIGDVPIKDMKLKNHISFWVGKLSHIVLFIVVPIYVLGVGAWAIGFFTSAVVAGLSLSIVFQLAHTVTDTVFPEIKMPENKLEDEFALHQLKTTANFAMNSKVVSWLVGGLNFQIEHHLFPKVSHIHYPAISKIVQQVCKEYNIPYINNSTLWKAIKEHVKFLKLMGRNLNYGSVNHQTIAA